MSPWDAISGVAGGGGITGAVVGLLTVLGALLAAYVKGRGDRARKTDLDQARQTEAAHRRMNHAEDHRGKSDAELRNSLHTLADRIERKR